MSLIQEQETQKGKYLIFSLEEEEYGIEIKYVTEIIRIQPITQVPELPEHVKGVINLRGKIIPVMDIRMRFKKEPRAYDKRTCIIVVDIQDISLGLIVEGVDEVVKIPEGDIALPPQADKNSQHKYVKGIGKTGSGVKILLDADRLLDEQEVEALEGGSLDEYADSSLAGRGL